MVVKLLPDPSKKTSTDPNASFNKRRSQSASLPVRYRPEENQGRRLPDANDLRKMCIITKNDLNRIYGNLERRQREKDSIRQELERKQELAARSAELTKHWPNTILGAREQKLETKRLREQQEEERRKQIDIEEEKLAAERRREQIEKAKQAQYYQTDRVRTFHSALLMTEVLKERELQLEMKKRLEEIRRSDEDDVRERFRDAQNEYNRIEREKNEKKNRDRAELAQYHLAQAEQRKLEEHSNKQKDRQEGEEYRRLAQQYALEQMEIERYRRLRQQDTKTMYDQSLEEKNQVKNMEKILDEEEDEELRIYANAKKNIARLRREREIKAHQEKQEARDHMVGYLGSLQKRAEADNDTQIFRAQAQREAKELREEQEKLEKRKKMQESIEKFRHETIKRREAQREIDEREDAEMRAKKAETDELYHIYQQEKDKKRRQDAHSLVDFRLKQAEERKDRARALKQAEIEEVQLDRHTNEIEKQQYQDYAGRVISYLEENGRNTYPMKKAYAEELRRFDEFNQNSKASFSSTSQTDKKTKSLDDTKKNLGFQWEITKK